MSEYLLPDDSCAVVDLVVELLDAVYEVLDVSSVVGRGVIIGTKKPITPKDQQALGLFPH